LTGRDGKTLVRYDNETGKGVTSMLAAAKSTTMAAAEDAANVRLSEPQPTFVGIAELLANDRNVEIG
jgi:hypothetical protein